MINAKFALISTLELTVPFKDAHIQTHRWLAARLLARLSHL